MDQPGSGVRTESGTAVAWAVQPWHFASAWIERGLGQWKKHVADWKTTLQKNRQNRKSQVDSSSKNSEIKIPGLPSWVGLQGDTVALQPIDYPSSRLIQAKINVPDGPELVPDGGCCHWGHVMSCFAALHTHLLTLKCSPMFPKKISWNKPLSTGKW